MENTSNCCSNYVAPAVGAVGFALLEFPAFAPKMASDELAEICAGNDIARWVWAYPCSLVVNVVGFVLQPITSLISLIAAGIFLLLSKLFDGDVPEKDKVFENFARTGIRGAQLITEMEVLFIRIYYPLYKAGQHTFK